MLGLYKTFFHALKLKLIKFFLMSACALVFLTPQAKAQFQPFQNLGFSSFLDGAPPSGPGLYLQYYSILYHSDTFRDGSGDVVPFPEFTLYANVIQATYVNSHVFPGNFHLGVNALLPLIYHNDLGKEGIGDFFFGPFMQFNPVMGKRGPIFVHRLEVPVAFPIGTYSNQDIVSPGFNIWYVNPYWAFTAWPLPEWTISARFHYHYNGVNNDPNVNLFPGAPDAQAGQSFHVNFASAYEVWPKRVRLGINGYFLRQFTDTKIGGTSIPNSQEQVFAIGPGMLFHITRDDHIFVNGYYEMLARNRPERLLFNVRYVHNFPVGRRDPGMPAQ